MILLLAIVYVFCYGKLLTCIKMKIAFIGTGYVGPADGSVYLY